MMMTADPKTAPAHGPIAEIDLSALCANYAMIRDAAPEARVSAAVKCNAYGLGLTPVARALFTREKCDEFFVAYPEEGAELREALNNAAARIYCFAGPSEETIALYERVQMTPVINSLAQAELWAKHGSGPAVVHIDTGMNRLGAPMNEAQAIAETMSAAGREVTIVMSHLACASDPAHPKNKDQREKFLEGAQRFPGAQLSLAASAGALMDKAYQFDLVRPGIALYGGSPFDADDKRIGDVVTLKAPIVQLRELQPGETVGYGATFAATAPMRIATVSLGYGDGYPRNDAPAGAAIVNGALAPIVGRVSMDFITLDITSQKNPVKIGDYAEFFGPNLRLFDAAAATRRVPYDLLTGLGGRIDRRYL